MQVLLLEKQLKNEEAYFPVAIERLKQELNNRRIKVITSESLDDATSIIVSNTALDSMLLTKTSKEKSVKDKELLLIDKLHERQPNVPIFLVTERGQISSKEGNFLNLMEKINEFVWILEDSVDFIVGRMLFAIKAYRETIIPPLASEMKKYHDTHEYSWAAPGHQGGVAFRKTPAGRAFYQFYGENLFTTDIGIERAQVGSLLDHTKAFRKSEESISRIFGSDLSFSGVVGTSGSNRSVMQFCIRDRDEVVVDRNCHKSIEQGLILTGAKPTYLVPSRNKYGIIGPISIDEIEKAIKTVLLQSRTSGGSSSSSSSSSGTTGPVYGVITNCTYDGICYNAKKIEELLKFPYLHFDEAWYGYARFNPIYDGHYAMRGNAEDSKGRQQTIFATQSTHKMLNALSMASYIHVRNGSSRPVEFGKFNQAYMMHTTTSPLYAIAAANDIAAKMMDGRAGKSLTREMIDEAVDFRQALARLYNDFKRAGDWFFKPWNIDQYDGVAFEDLAAKELATDQKYWILKSTDTWHAFEDLDDDWVMLDPVKVSVLTPVKQGVPAALVNAWLMSRGIVPTRTTNYQIMILFSMGITKGKWSTLINHLLSFKRHYDANVPIEKILPELSETNAKYRSMGLRDLGVEMSHFIVQNDLEGLLNEAFQNLPVAEMTPREGYQKLIGSSELVAIKNLPGRIAVNAIIPYPPGIPMIMSGERFGDKTSSHIKYLAALEKWDNTYPGFEHELSGTEIQDGKYQILCAKNE